MPPSHRLLIKNFGPLRDCELEIPEALVLIGEQASGKSTLARLIYFFQSLPEEIEAFSVSQAGVSNVMYAFKKRLTSRFVGMFGSTLGLPPFEVRYTFQDGISIQISKTRARGSAQWEVSSGFRAALQSSFLQYATGANQLELFEEPELHLHEAMRQMLEGSLRRTLRANLHQQARTLFIPAGRSLLATLSGELRSIDSYNFDPLMKSFAQHIFLLRRHFNAGLEGLLEVNDSSPESAAHRALVERATSMVSSILRGRYVYQSGQDRIYFDSEHFVELRLASSGQQEALWILLLILSALVTEMPAFTVIEEPEAHLFPRAQKEITELLALYKNVTHQAGEEPVFNRLVITTHSPYILSALNNLLYAWELAKQGKAEQVKAIVDERLWLDPDRLAVYFVEEGGLRSILDPELRQIRAEEIDGASSAINRQYDALFELEGE